MKKLNNKTLIIILVVLVGVFALVRIFRTPAQRSNLKQELVSLDTAAVTQIKLSPKTLNGELIFLLEGKKWVVKKSDKTYKTEQSAVKSMLSQLIKLTPQKMVTRKKEKWNDYQVGDSTTRVQVFAGKDIVADIKIGRIGFNQSPAQMQQQQYGGGFGGAFTYVRVADEDEVYTVDGFLETPFNKPLNYFRDKSFVNINKEDITKITFNYPDSGFVLDKGNNEWWVGSQVADSIKVKNYLSGLSFKNATTFADDFSTTQPATLTVTIEKMGITLAILEAWKREQDWVLTSSQQPDVYFSNEGSGLFQTLFEQQKDLVPVKK